MYVDYRFFCKPVLSLLVSQLAETDVGGGGGDQGGASRAQGPSGAGVCLMGTQQARHRGKSHVTCSGEGDNLLC